MTRAEELLAQVLKKDKEECKVCKIILWVLAIIGIIAAAHSMLRMHPSSYHNLPSAHTFSI